MKPKVSDDDIIRLFPLVGAAGIAQQFGMQERNVYERRRSIENRHGINLTSPSHTATEHPGRIHIEVENGVVLVGSDAHYFPDRISTAHRAFVKFCKIHKPAVVVMNGDVFDGATVSRHPPMGWESLPSVAEELEACKDRLGEIEKASGKAQRIWTLGNHDARFETCIATRAPAYAKVDGVHLKDHFPHWEPCWSVWINNDVVIKHRNRGGIHATRNNTLNAGKSIVTGHLHSLKVAPVSDYNGHRWGVDSGTLADPYGPQFEYTEDNVVDWRSGFVVLTFENGELRQPETALVVREGVIDFRGKTFNV